MLKNGWTKKIRELNKTIAFLEKIIEELKEKNNKLMACPLSERGIALAPRDRLAKKQKRRDNETHNQR